MLEIRNVQVKYGSFVAVHDLSFTLEPGQIFGLLGTNGAGKTTTFRVIMGLMPPTKGEALFFGEAVGYHNVDTIGYMIEERSLLTKITVKELLLYFGQLKNMTKADILTRMDHWLDVFGITEYKDKKIKELSKGNQQKIQFISAIINNPKLLVLDEPFSGLDPINTALFVDVIRQFQAAGAMIVFSSHQLDHVESFCEQIVVLERGHVVMAGDIRAIKDDFKKLTVHVQADVEQDALRALPGVYAVNPNARGLEVKIASDDYIDGLFDYVKTRTSVRRFDVEQASLSEIFIAKVGDSREKI
ncbi:MAG: ATP-binding cassette domain-containing protein [Acholeplasmatales bacterium]|nr:MAG: ATP-binding cassette domain-containing protein [Acholeplasmatales bacterium]